MWVRVGLIVLQLLGRLAIRLAPFLAVVGAGLVRKYRWRVYDRVRYISPRDWPWSRVPVFIAALLLGLIAFAAGLYVLVGRLAPG